MELPATTDNYSERRSYSWPSRVSVSNLDVFFSNMYKYYYHGGLASILLSEMCSVISLAFTVGFSIFLIAFLDWTRLVKCHDEHSCHKLSNYVVSHPFEHSSPHAVSAMVYMILCISYWMWKCGESIYTISSAIEMDCFYRDRLGITGELQNIKWNEVLERLIRLHEKRIFRVAVKEELSEHDVVSRIMRKDNYMVGLINKGLLNLKSPWWLSPFVGADSLVLTQSLEWSLNYCILDHMFDDQSFTVSSTFLKDRQGLEWRFVMMGIIHFLLLPFLLVFMIIHFFLQNAQTFHTSKAYLGPRQWSPLALWTFREFNELPHIFEERIHKSVAPTQEYIGLFQNPYLSQIAKCVSYVAGALVATLVLVSFVDEGILLYVQALDHNLFWYLGVFSAIFATARAIIPDESKFVTQSSMISPTKDPEELVRIFSAHTHTMRNEWMGKCHTDKVFNEVSELFPYKVHIFAMEIYSVIITPIVLCFSLPSCTGNIIRFIRDHTSYVDGVGSVLDYATFEQFEQYGDENFGAPPGALGPSDRAVDGKMEKSFINFQKNHPQWHPKNAGGQAVMKSIQSFRDSRIRVRDENMVSMLQQSLMLGPNMSMMGGSGLHMGGVTHAAASVPSKSTVPGTTYVGSRHPAQVAPMPTTRNTQELYHNPSGPPVSSSGRMQSEEGAEFIRDTSAADSETQDAAVGPFADNSVSVREDSPVMRNQDSLGDVHGDQSCSNGIVTPDMSNIVVAPVISLDQLQANEPEYVNSLLNSRPASLPREQQTQESSVPGVSLQRIVSDGINPDGSGGYNGNVINSYMQSNSNLGVDSGTQMQLHSILRSVLKQENIDYENDFYWMDMLQKERLRESTTVRGQKHSPVSAVPRVGSGRLSPPRNFQSFSHNRPVSNDRSRPVQSQQSLLQSGEGSLDQPLLQGHSRPSRGVSSPMGSLLGVFGSQLNVIWEGKADKPDDSVPTRSAGSGHYPHQLPFGGSRYHYGGGGPRSSNRGISPAPLPPRASSLLSPRGDLLGAQSARNRTNTGIGNRNTHSTDEHTALLDNEEEEEDAIASV